jgi:predicted nucleic acid-binding protein
LQEIRDRLRIVALTAEEHFRALQDAAGANIVAGAAYEALLMRCAAKAGALTLFTWNVRHFSHLGFSGVERVQTVVASQYAEAHNKSQPNQTQALT